MSATERQIKEGLAIERESREVDNLLNGKGEWGINIVPRLQTEKDRLGKIEENQALTSSTNGKRQAEFRENQPTATHSFSSISPAQNDNAELAFSGQYRQRKKARLTHKASDTSEGQTRPMSQGSALGTEASNSKGVSSKEPSGLVKRRQSVIEKTRWVTTK